MDEDIVKPQDNLYTIAWEADFNHELFERGSDSWPDTCHTPTEQRRKQRSRPSCRRRQRAQQRRKE